MRAYDGRTAGLATNQNAPRWRFLRSRWKIERSGERTKGTRESGEGKCLALAMCVHLYPSVFSRRKPWVHPTCPFRLPLRCQKRIIEKEERSGGSAAFRRHKRASSRCLWRGSYGTMLRSPNSLCPFSFFFLLYFLREPHSFLFFPPLDGNSGNGRNGFEPKSHRKSVHFPKNGTGET